MSEDKSRRTVTVTNPEGVHARAATLIAELAGRFEAGVALSKEQMCVSATEVLQIMSLGAGCGEELVIEATGNDAERVIEELVRLFADNFGEKQQDTDENINQAESRN